MYKFISPLTTAELVRSVQAVFPAVADKLLPHAFVAVFAAKLVVLARFSRRNCRLVVVRHSGRVSAVVFVRAVHALRLPVAFQEFW